MRVEGWGVLPGRRGRKVHGRHFAAYPGLCFFCTASRLERVQLCRQVHAHNCILTFSNCKYAAQQYVSAIMTKGTAGLRVLISTPSCSSLTATTELQGWSPRSTESQVVRPLVVRTPGQLMHLLVTRLLAFLASCAVTTYDLLMRLVMSPSWYILGLDTFPSSDAYLMARAEKKTRRYIQSATNKFYSAVLNGQVILNQKEHLSQADFAFARDIFCGKHGKPWLLYFSWRLFVTLLTWAPDSAWFTTVTDTNGTTLAVFVDFRQGNNMHHFITALVDHDASKQYGIYIAKYEQLLRTCVLDGVPLLRLGPTTDALKESLGAIPLPLFVVGSPVWARLQGRCSVVAFGVFTTIGLLAFTWLTQWQMDASGVGRLTPGEFLLMYGCCIAVVKILPLQSIGWRKVLANPRKYLLQTSFYAQGVIFGGVLFIAIMAYTRQVSPLRLLDAICMFAFVGDAVGRIGCHFYGCCFGYQLNTPTVITKTTSDNPEQPKKTTPAPAVVEQALRGSNLANPLVDQALKGCSVADLNVARSLSRVASIGGSSSVLGGSSITCSSEDGSSVTEDDMTVPLPSVETARGSSQQNTKGSAEEQKTGAATDGVSTSATFQPWAVAYMDRQSSVTRMRPELRLQPLLPTQLMQAASAIAAQSLLMTMIAYNPAVETGLVGCYVLGVYSLGRCIFFFLRQDECFKSNRSYTTVHIGVGTLLGAVLLSLYLAISALDTTQFQLTWRPAASDVWAYTWVAVITAGINFLVQGLHHHEVVGRFPDLAALFAPPKRSHLNRGGSTDRLFLDGRPARTLSGGRPQAFNNWSVDGASQ